jgi:hypothetical protein
VKSSAPQTAPPFAPTNKTRLTLHRIRTGFESGPVVDTMASEKVAIKSAAIPAAFSLSLVTASGEFCSRAKTYSRVPPSFAALLHFGIETVRPTAPEGTARGLVLWRKNA